jgi:hypothetical protein
MDISFIGIAIDFRLHGVHPSKTLLTGRMALLQDPQGATIHVIEYSSMCDHG